MGYGDEIMGSGLALEVASRGKRAAFGDEMQRRIVWHYNAHQVFKHNPDVAPPGSENDPDIEWIPHYPGRRLYCANPRPTSRRMRRVRKWEFTPGTQRAGKFYFTPFEKIQMLSFDPGFIVIEPNVKRSAPNKQWPQERYAKVAELLMARGYSVIQFETEGVVLPGVRQVRALNFRMAALILSRAALYIGPEGGLHHAAAALDVDIPAVVNFGGFISPRVTGYKKHTNIFGGTDLGCGQINPCTHCQKIMQRITVEQVLESSLKILREKHEISQSVLLAGSRGTFGLVSGEGADLRQRADVPAAQIAGSVAPREELQKRD